MIENLLLTNLFLVANSLITISFVLFGFLHLDLYLKKKENYTLYIGLGGLLMALSFACGLFFEIKSVGALKEYIILILQFLGLLFIALGYVKEIEPKTSGQKKTKVSSVILPFFASFLFFANFFLAAFIASKNMYKLHFGIGEKVKPLFSFWLLISFIFLLNLISFFSDDRFSLVEISLSKYSFMWVMIQLSLLIAFILMYKWVRTFLSPKSLTKIVFDIWSFAIFICVFVTSLFLTLSMPNYEKDILKTLDNNVNVIEFNLEQIEKSNSDFFKNLSLSQDRSSLEEQLDFFLAENVNLDRAFVLDEGGEIVYSSENYDFTPYENLIDMALSEWLSQDDYYVSSSGLVYEIVQPLFLKDSFLGVAVGIKGLNYEYLSYLNSLTGREFLLLDNSNNLLASFLYPDLLCFDDVVKIGNVKYLNEKNDIYMTINGYPYLGSVVETRDRFGNVAANLIVLDSYDLVASTAQNSMYLVSFYGLIFSIVSFVPSYFFAKRIDRVKCSR